LAVGKAVMVKSKMLEGKHRFKFWIDGRLYHFVKCRLCILVMNWETRIRPD